MKRTQNKDLKLSYYEPKQEVLVGVWSKSLCDAMLTKQHFNADHLLHDMHDFLNVEIKRNEIRNKSFTCQERSEQMRKQENDNVSRESSTESTRTPFLPARDRNGRPLCFRCKKYGHTSKYCRSIVTTDRRSTAPQASNVSEQTEASAMNINTEDNSSKKEFYTTLDLKNGFYHVDMDENSITYTAFVVHNGQYEFLKMPFGLTNSPSIFQRYINFIFQDHIQDNRIQIYMDDLLIATNTIDENLQILKDVINRMMEHNLKLRMDKCQFLQTSIDYLGYRICVGKIQNVPSNDFEIYNPDLETQLHTDACSRGYGAADACSRGYGAVLMQKHENTFHPVYYFSAKTSDTESRSRQNLRQTTPVLLLPENEEVCEEMLRQLYRMHKNITNEGYLHSIDKGDRPFDTLHLDHLKIPEKSRQGHKYILCIVDAFSKFTFLEPTKTTNATEVLKVMYQLTKIFGRPRRIITDRGAAFTSQAFVQFCAEHNIKLVNVAVQTPRANGQVERLYKVIMPALLKENETHEEWTGSLIKIQLKGFTK
ncbi:Integrase core domain [Popillia japonica]|uniref:Integrase core domain n=1 Tax=Popillia japonica TaxID=7064 RepID=A0AAW1J342_POPJA